MNELKLSKACRCTYTLMSKEDRMNILFTGAFFGVFAALVALTIVDMFGLLPSTASEGILTYLVLSIIFAILGVHRFSKVKKNKS